MRKATDRRPSAEIVVDSDGGGVITLRVPHGADKWLTALWDRIPPIRSPTRSSSSTSRTSRRRSRRTARSRHEVKTTNARPFAGAGARATHGPVTEAGPTTPPPGDHVSLDDSADLFTDLTPEDVALLDK